MIINIVLGGLIFGYAGYTLVKFVRKSKEGKCAACSLNNSCSTANPKSCSTAQPLEFKSKMSTKKN